MHEVVTRGLRRGARIATWVLRRSRVARLLVRVAVGLWAPRQRLGAIALILDDREQVLLVEHALRVRRPWGFPGGWVERGEHPEDGLARELREELGLAVEVGELLRCAVHGEQADGDGPGGLTLVYAARLAPGEHAAPAARSWELFDAAWLPAADAARRVRAFEAEALAAALQRAPRAP